MDSFLAICQKNDIMKNSQSFDMEICSKWETKSKQINTSADAFLTKIRSWNSFHENTRDGNSALNFGF